jgi:hypothetical protein
MHAKQLSVGLVLLLVAPAFAQERQPASQIEPDAMAALGRMGAFLLAQRSFAVEARFARDEVLEDGFVVQLGGTTQIWADRPTRLRAAVSTTRKHREFFYDGRSFTIFAPRDGYYATVGAPATVDQLIDYVEERFNVELPLIDLFSWGTPRADMGAIQAATDVGPDEVDGKPCEQYAFRQPDVDWQVCIQKGQPYPLKLVIIATDQPERPRYQAVIRWKQPITNPSFYRFVPPPGATPIPFRTLPAYRAPER